MGVASFITQTWPPKPKFSVNDIPDLSGKVVLITGGNSGVGFETAKALLPRGAKVYIACRNQKKGELAVERLKKETGKEPILHSLDLSNLKSVKASSEDFLRKEDQLHILFNNAGVMVPPASELTADGYDLTFGTNVLGHFYFTQLLLPALLNVAKKSPGEKSRVVNTSSVASELASKLRFETYKDGPARNKTSVDDLYLESKFANLVYSTEFARRYGDQGIVSVAVNPGNLQTELQRTLTGVRRWVVNRILYPAPMGALTQLYAGTCTEGVDFNGKYFIPWARPHPPSRASQDPALGQKLWGWLEDQVKDI